MNTGTIVLIVVVILVVIGIVAFILTQGKSRRVESERAKAEEIREDAADRDRELREREAHAAEARAQSELAEAEAQKRQLEAERLQKEAGVRTDEAGTVRAEREEQLREADKHDPDVETDKEGYRLDEHGNRLPTPAPGTAGGAAVGTDHATHEHGVTGERHDTGDLHDERRDSEHPDVAAAGGHEGATRASDDPRDERLDGPNDPDRRDRTV